MTSVHSDQESLLSRFSRELEALSETVALGVVSVNHTSGHGSGVVLTPDGYLLTNDHVIDGAGALNVSFIDGMKYPATLVGRDPQTDLAVLHVPASRLQSLSLAADHEARVGQLVIAVGNPLRFERSVTLGLISALYRRMPHPNGTVLEGLIQTDASINPGNSGGPLVNAAGHVVGINTAVVPYAQGLGFAIPSATANWVASVLISKGEVRRRYLGIVARSVEVFGTEEEARPQRNLAASRLYIEQVASGSPADRANLRRGDVLMEIDRRQVHTVDDLQKVLVLNGAPELELKVRRGQTEIHLNVRPRHAA